MSTGRWVSRWAPRQGWAGAGDVLLVVRSRARSTGSLPAGKRRWL